MAQGENTANCFKMGGAAAARIFSSTVEPPCFPTIVSFRRAIRFIPMDSAEKTTAVSTLISYCKTRCPTLVSSFSWNLSISIPSSTFNL